MQVANKSFIQMVLDGEADLSDIDDHIDTWHRGPSEGSLDQFLGMTREEYVSFVRDENNLAKIIAARKPRN